MSDTRRALIQRIEADRDRLVRFLQDFTRIDTSNPPGDTREGAAFIGRFLDAARLPYRRIAPQETMPNIVASTRFGRPGRHLVLNGHIDVFPSGERGRWTRDPLSGDLADGRVHGRGTVDMKCGTTASIFTYLYLSGLAEQLRGTVTLTLVSDEETGGRWGSGYLVEHEKAEVLGDCMLNGEPSSPHTVRFGEKAVFWMKFAVRTPGGHSAYPHVSKSANRIAAALIRDLESLESIAPVLPEKVGRALSQPGVTAGAERGLGKGAGEFLQKVTLNIGVMRGGVKVNMLPSSCEIEADARLPVGVDRAEIRKAVDQIVARYPEVSWEEGATNQAVNATWSDPEHEMVGHLQDNVEALLGFRPPAIISLGGTDCRFWRAAGVPAYVYGCSPSGMGAPDESVAVDEFLHVVRVHTLSAFDYLSRGGNH
ncbi:MAG TPA: M20/M25/M40 family metallo-hydrolase [Candidatus Methylomirabilis sp.]|nr:M20/M25/M40 family metallo-hydrolase [Candidatus Methylomirabilis sp.]